MKKVGFTGRNCDICTLMICSASQKAKLRACGCDTYQASILFICVYGHAYTVFPLHYTLGVSFKLSYYKSDLLIVMSTVKLEDVSIILTG